MLRTIWYQNDPWGMHVRSMAKTVGEWCDRAFLESLDGTVEAAGVERALEFATGRRLCWVSPAVLRLADFLELDLDSEALFPNYSGVWFAEQGTSIIRHPGFNTWSAGLGQTPVWRARLNDPAGWEIVARWMAENRIAGGVASGQAILTVRRESD